MFYFYTILLPILILLLVYFIEGKPDSKRKFVNYFFKSFIILIIYGLFLYFLEMENYINSGWAFYTIMFFLIPFGIIIIPLRIYFSFKKE